MTEVKLEGLRSLQDFALDASRFDVPKRESWGRRVKANLIYYQSNYFVLFAILFLLEGLLRPTQILVGMVATLALGFAVNFLSGRPGATERIRQNHPLFCLIGIAGIVYLVLGYFFLVAILLPVLIIFLHASMRLRNLNNKMANQAEKVGLKKTPMGMFLDELGVAFFDALDD